MHDLVLNYWPIFLALVAVGIWLVRLEASTKENTKSLAAVVREHDKAMKRLEEQRREDLEAARQSRGEVMRALETVQNDLKLILGKLGGK